jgi:hypothetical protein
LFGALPALGQQKKAPTTQEQIEAVSTEVEYISDSLWRHVLGFKSVSFEPESAKTFRRLDADLGMFYVSLESMEPFADGYKAIFEILNPYAATFSNLKLKVRWAPRREEGTPFVKWRASRRERDFSTPVELLPGRWTKLEIVLSPATAKDVGYVQLDELEFRTVGPGR